MKKQHKKKQTGHQPVVLYLLQSLPVQLLLLAEMKERQIEGCEETNLQTNLGQETILVTASLLHYYRYNNCSLRCVSSRIKITPRAMSASLNTTQLQLYDKCLR